MSYDPETIDTSSVKLPNDLTQLTELLAKNAHDHWAKKRLAEGWQHGPNRDDARKEHPNLIPYEALSESEKEYDRQMAIETIKAIITLGYYIGRHPIDVH